MLVQRQLPLLGVKGCWLASFKGHTLDLEVIFCSHVTDGLQVQVVGELECVSIWQLDSQLCLVKGDAHLYDSSRLEGEDRLPTLLLPHPAFLLLHTMVLMSPCILWRQGPPHSTLEGTPQV